MVFNDKNLISGKTKIYEFEHFTLEKNLVYLEYVFKRLIPSCYTFVRAELNMISPYNADLFLLVFNDIGKTKI